jgi:hypothetical protein
VTVPLAQQIDEIEHELMQRKLVYPRLVSRGSMRQSIADLQIARLAVARDTLVWLKANEATIAQRLAP